MVRFLCDLCPRTFPTEAKLKAHREKDVSRPRTLRSGSRLRHSITQLAVDPRLIAQMIAAAEASNASAEVKVKV